MRGVLAALSRVLFSNAIALAGCAGVVVGLASIEPSHRVGLVPPVLIVRAAMPADLSDVGAIAEPDWMNFAAEFQSPSVFVDPLPMPRPRFVARVALLNEAEHWVGASARQLGVRLDLWCAAAINKFLANIGIGGTHSDLAISFLQFGQAAQPAPGVIALKHRRGGSGHVAIVVAVLDGDRLLTISPNHKNRVRLAIYPASVFYAFREPRHG